VPTGEVLTLVDRAELADVLEASGDWAPVGCPGVITPPRDHRQPWVRARLNQFSTEPARRINLGPL
jgi:hypothetical protein